MSERKNTVTENNQDDNKDSVLPLLLGILASIGLLMIIIFKIHK